MWLALAFGWCSRLLVGVWACLLLHTLAKWPTLWQWAHIWLYVGHWRCSPLCMAAPHPGHIGEVWRAGWYEWWRAVTSQSQTFVQRCFLAASLLQHLAIAVVKIRLFSCNKSSTTSPSLTPLIIWSRIVFSIQLYEQNLHILVRSHSEMMESSKFSPGCCLQWRKFWRSTVSFRWPSTYAFNASMMAVTSFFHRW